MTSPRTMTISMAGKGGTGKTTTTALFLIAARKQKPPGEILVVDADPASNIPDILGVDGLIPSGRCWTARRRQ